jgi:hypothetical protein
LRGSSREDRPAALVATDDRIAQHAPNQGAATSTAAGAGADSGTFTYLLEGFRAALNRFEHGALADLVAQACGLQILDDRLFSRFTFELVDDAPLGNRFYFTFSLAQRSGAATKYKNL